MPITRTRGEIPSGALDMLILKALSRAEQLHGFEIGNEIQRSSEDALQVEEGSLCPALQSMLIKGWRAEEWRKTTENRRPRYRRLTRAGHKQLAQELQLYERIGRAIDDVRKPVWEDST